ncbi:response regulator [uncultured Prevotella sp.]|uniref:hybrid sensor histidine kinase/response regulator transcription factor n=1 Tax=uncultured Prevotella sp. TaxID=159272 RepID=UPI00258946EF|nr:response regulator [uncultured Prevotella sp.]
MKHIIAPILLLLASACSNERGGLVFSDEERDSKDAILSKVLSVDSLNDMLLDYEEQKDELGQIVAYRYLGIRYREENQVSTALNRHQHGLAHANEMSDTIEMVSAHNQIAINYLHMGQLENAAQHLLNSLALCTQYKDRYNKRAQENLAETYYGIGHIFLLLQNRDQANGAIRAAQQIERQLYGESKTANATQTAQYAFNANDSLIMSKLDKRSVTHIYNMCMEQERFNNVHNMKQTQAYFDMQRSQKNMFLIVAFMILMLAIAIIGVLWYHLRSRNVKQIMMRDTQRVREIFFRNVTHEFRTPLTVILGISHQLENEDIEDVGQVRSAAKMIVRQSNSLLALINQLLDISKIRSAVGEPRWRHGDIIAFTNMIIQNFQPYAESKRQELTFTHSLTQLEMDFVPDYVQKMLSNLLSNSIKYTPQYGKINITVEKWGNKIKLQVFDTGIGIPKSEKAHVFDAFFQGERLGEEIGTGIGLSVVKLTVEAMDGSVTVDSIEGQGSTFTIILPAKHTDALKTDEYPNFDANELEKEVIPLPKENEENQTQFSIQKPSQAMAISEGKQILIVEDNQDIAQYIAQHLTQANVLFARNGAEGLQKAKETVPDMIITDVMMPGTINGLQMCRDIRNDELLNHIPIIIISAKTTEEDRIEGLDAGADAYLVKPFNSEELLVRVRKLLERQQRIRDKMANLSIDENAPDATLSAADRQFLNRIVDTTYRLMAKGNVDMETVASEMALSRNQLNRKVMALTGQNSSAYIMKLRLARAKRLLKADITMSVGDVALKCGFDDMGYFSRVFKQSFDMTPSQYRKNC